MPTVAPLANGPRLRWSVMIPSYNSADLLRSTIQSVLSQDPGPRDMEVIVIDDASTDHTAGVVEEFDDRVSYWRQATNVGAIANFNTCLERSQGELVHILHADDLVRPGFYRRLDEVFSDTAIGAVLTRCDYIDENGTTTITTRSERTPSGIWTDALDALAVSCRVRPPAFAARRSVYEAIGGFDPTLPHAADWEMWSRIAAQTPIWFEDQALAAYRVHSAQDTAGLMKTGANVRERVDCIDRIAQYVPEQRRAKRKRQALGYAVLYASRTAGRLARRGEWNAARHQMIEATRCLALAARVR